MVFSQPKYFPSFQCSSVPNGIRASHGTGIVKDMCVQWLPTCQVLKPGIQFIWSRLSDTKSQSQCTTRTSLGREIKSVSKSLSPSASDRLFGEVCHWPWILTFKWSLYLAFPSRHVDSCFDKAKPHGKKFNIPKGVTHPGADHQWSCGVLGFSEFCLPVTCYSDETTNFCLISNNRLLVDHKWELTLYPLVNLPVSSSPPNFRSLPRRLRLRSDRSTSLVHKTTLHSPRPLRPSWFQASARSQQIAITASVFHTRGWLSFHILYRGARVHRDAKSFLEPIGGLPYLEITTQEKFLARGHVLMDESTVLLSCVSYYRTYNIYMALT